jgi:chromosome segregation ATPase
MEHHDAEPFDYADIINQVVADAIDREVENRLAAKNGEIASLKELLAGRDKEVAKLTDEINELKRKGFENAPLDGGAITRTYGTSLMSAMNVQQNEIADLKDQVKKKDQELITIRGTVLERGRRIENLQTELNAVRDALKYHVDSEGKLKKDLDDANAKIADLRATVDERDTQIEELDTKVEEKDDLIGKYKDMADALSDWANNDMPSLDPDDYC